MLKDTAELIFFISPDKPCAACYCALYMLRCDCDQQPQQAYMCKSGQQQGINSVSVE